MGLFEQFPYSNFHELNLDWLVEVVKTLKNNLVVSVNGQTGEVVLYQDPNVRFPDVDSTNWTLVRTAGGHELGIQFQNGLAYLRFDNNTERIYTTGNPPPYPVTSVDGQTGAVQVFPNADTVLPPVNNTNTILRRQIKDSNNQDIFTGIQAEADVLKRLSGTNLYPIYDQGNPPPYPVTSVNGSTGAIVLAIPFADVSGQEWTASAQSPTNVWELSRYTQNGALATIRLTTANGLTEGYLEYFDEGTQTTITKKILTNDDIPSSAGVVSLNGMTGVVTIYGDSIPIVPNSPYSIEDITTGLDTRLTTAEGTITQHGNDIGTIQTNIEKTKADIAIVENTNNATHNITAGQYVVWKGDLYQASANISTGAGLSGSNLTAVSDGGLNDLIKKYATVTVYTDLPSMGLTSPATLAAIYAAMAQPSIALLNASDVDVNDRVGPETTYSSGYVKIEKKTAARSRIFYYHKTDAANDREMAITTSNTPTGIWINKNPDPVFYSDYSAVAKTHTIAFTEDKAVLIYVTFWGGNDSTKTGLYLAPVSTSATSAAVKAIAAATGVTVSLSGRTLTVDVTNTYTAVSVYII